MIGGNILKYVCLVQLLEWDESGREWSKILSRPRFALPVPHIGETWRRGKIDR